MPDDRLQHVLGHLQGAKPRGDGYEARCPAHDDRHASLSVNTGTDGRVLLHCHAGCSPIAVCRAMGLRMGDLFPTNGNGTHKGSIVATYDYCNAAGELLYQSVRFDPKDFRQRRPAPGRPGEWEWKLNGTPRVLYRLPELTAAPDDAWTFIVEGEKDVDRLTSLGLVATTCPQGAGKWSKLSDDSVLHGRRVAIIPDNDAPGRDHAQDVAMRLQNRAAEIRVITLPDGHKDVSDYFDAGGTVEQLMALLETATPAPVVVAPVVPAPDGTTSSGGGGRPTILIDTEEYRVVTQTVAALNADPDIYQRGGILVRVVRAVQDEKQDGIVRCTGSATIQSLPTANLRERMTRFASFTRINKEGAEVPSHPAPWLVAAVDARGEWPGIRPLLGVSDAPILRHDGTIWQTPGYDAQTGVLYQPLAGCDFPAIDADVSQDDADAAMQDLLDVVCDFPFESPEHRAAWVAAVLTPLARFAFRGPSPLFLIDANIRGAGKGLLAQTIGQIVLGREMPVSSYAHDSEEMRKKITAIAIAGDRVILLDNLENTFGNDALDRALTTTMWKDRILGKSEEVELPLMPAWYATGNNVQVAADTARRVIHIRLDVLDERPEERRGFKHDNLVAWLEQHRPRLLASSLTILSAYLRRGSPDRSLTPFGSFEGWSSVVRQAVVWAGLPDPCATRAKLAESADTTVDVLSQLITAWRQYDPSNQGVLVSQMLTELYDQTEGFHAPDRAEMRAAIEALAYTPAGRKPAALTLSKRIASFRRRVIQGVYIDHVQALGRKNGRIWRLFRA